MAVIPLQEEVGQELYTRDHGTVKVEKMSFMDGGYHIVKCPNGAYMHANGLPVQDEEELRAAIPKEFLQDALDWFSKRHEQEANPPRPIGFNSDNTPVFADGTIPDFDDLYAFFRPGPILTAAIVALQEYKQREAGQAVPKKQAQVAHEAPAMGKDVAPPEQKVEKKAKPKSKSKSKSKKATPKPASAPMAAAGPGV